MDDLDDMLDEGDEGGWGTPVRPVRAPYQPDGFGGVYAEDFDEEVLSEFEELIAA